MNVGRILKDYHHSGAFNALVSVHAAIGDGVFLTKGGDLLTWLSLRGGDAECLDPEETDQMGRRFEASLRLFDERFRLNQYVMKREHPELPFGQYTDPVVEEAVAGRARYLAGKPEQLCSLENYMAIIFEGWRPAGHRTGFLQSLAEPQKSLARLLSGRQMFSSLDQDLETARDLLVNKVASFRVQLSEFLTAQVLDTQRGFAVLRRLLNYAPHKSEGLRLKYASFVDFQACDSSLECHPDFLRLDDDYVQVLTLKDLPARTHADLLRSLYALPANYIIASEWKREPVQTARALIQSKRRHFHNSKASMLNFVTASGGTAPRDLLIDDGAAAVVASLGGSLEELEVQGRYFGQYSLTLILYHKDLGALRRSVAQAFKIFAAFDAQLTEERYNRLNAFLAVLPGNGAYNLRRLWLLNTNYADLAFLSTPDSGERQNDHLGQEYLAIVEGATGTPYFLNLHAKDIGHSLILGATGAGKSFLLNFLLTHLQKYGPTTLIFDLGGSYESLTRLFDGAYVPLGASGRSLSINPFSLPPNKENLLFLFSFVKVLIESSGYQARPEEEQDLFEQIENLYSVDPEQRRLLTLANILPRNLRVPLQKWVQGGPYASLFDNAEDQVTLARFQTFDFEGMDRMPEQLEVLLFYILHRAQIAISEAPPEALKVFIIDEAWRFLRHPVIRAYIIEALKTWRKKNAVVLLATQSGEDLLASEILPLVAESCPTKLFLSNPGMDRAAYQRIFHLNETEAERIAGLAPKKEFLLKQPGVSKVLQLNVDRREYWIYTNNPPDNAKRRDAFERYGFRQGLELLGRTE